MSLMKRIVTVAAVSGLPFMAGAEVESGAIFADAEAAYARARFVAENAAAMTPEEASAANAMFEAALTQGPNARWELGRALVAFDARKYAEAEQHAQRATEIDPKLAEAHYWLGNSLFSGINDAGLLDKSSIASRGRKAYERAIEIEPNHVGARFALGQFFAGAPGIAGGSNKKARQQGEALIAIEGGKMLGHSLLAQLAAEDGKWDEANRQFTSALQACTSDEERLGARRSQASAVLRLKKDPKAALPLAESLVKDFPEDINSRYLLGVTRSELKDYTGALECFRWVFEKRPDSANVLFALAEAQRDTGALEEALASFETFAVKHEKDKRSSDAKSEAKKLRKKLGKK